MSEGGAGRSIGAALRATFSEVLVFGLLLLVPAGLIPGGTWLWPRGLALVAMLGVVSAVGNLALALWWPAHFQVRRQGVVASREKRQPLIDAVGSAVLLAIGAAWLISIPLDVFRLHLLAPPAAAVSIAGAVAVVVGLALTPLAVWENRFATPNVQEQADQTIVRSGIYRWVRHPIYLGNLLLAAGAPLWLGSYAGLWGFGALLVATVGRIAVEERDLRARVPEYADYASRVRARLIPFVI